MLSPRLGTEEHETQTGRHSGSGPDQGHEPCSENLPQERTPPVAWLQLQPLPVTLHPLQINAKTHLDLHLATLPRTALNWS